MMIKRKLLSTSKLPKSSGHEVEIMILIDLIVSYIKKKKI